MTSLNNSFAMGAAVVLPFPPCSIKIPYEERDHALYIAFGPYKQPRLSLIHI